MSHDATDNLNPLLSVWLRPRKTIEYIVATQPTRWVLGLTVFGGISVAIGELIIFHLLDWRILLLGAAGGAILAVLNLYVVSYLVAWLGRMMKGRATAQAIRASLAWSQLPAIVGSIAAAIVFGVANNFLGGTAASRPLSAALNLILVATALWSLLVLLLMIARVEQFGFLRAITAYTVAVIVLPVTLALGIRTLLFQPFYVAASSMAPTLLVGDYFFANKFAYGYSQFSLPFAPWGFSGRIFARDPQPGDVVVFALPKDPSITYIKRVVGVGGDHVQMKGGLLYLNGTPVQRERLSDVVGEFCGEPAAATRRWRETLPNGVSYETLDCVDNGFYDNTVEYVVPPGHAFMMGDNRDNSNDSRVLKAVGYVPLDHVFGRLSVIFYSRAARPNGGAIMRWAAD